MSNMATKGTGRGKPARPRRQFTDEFKDGAVRLVLDEKRSIREVSRDLDLTPSALTRWVEREQERRGIVREAPLTPTLTADERTELEQLRKRVRELEMEKAILKKAAAFFAKEST